MVLVPFPPDSPDSSASLCVSIFISSLPFDFTLMCSLCATDVSYLYGLLVNKANHAAVRYVSTFSVLFFHIWQTLTVKRRSWQKEERVNIKWYRRKQTTIDDNNSNYWFISPDMFFLLRLPSRQCCSSHLHSVFLKFKKTFYTFFFNRTLFMGCPLYMNIIGKWEREKIK